MLRFVLLACVVASALSASGCASDAASPDGDDEATAAVSSGAAKHHLRYLAINVGNVALSCRRYEYKLCSHDTSEQIRRYIATWQPDVVLLSEVLDEPQLDRVLHDSDLRSGGSTTSDLGGPLLPAEVGYDHVCHASVNRDTLVAGTAHPMDDGDASHRHECVAWRRDRLAFVSEAHVFGANSPALRSRCHFDFTAQAATLRLRGTSPPVEVTGIAPHPASDGEDTACRIDMLARLWPQLATAERVFLGGDFNTGKASELQVPPRFRTNYSDGTHFGVHHEGEYSAWYYVKGGSSLDHAYSTFGTPCTSCGRFYGGGTQDLRFGSALGSWDGHPWAAQPGIDHRQILVDLAFD